MLDNNADVTDFNLAGLYPSRTQAIRAVAQLSIAGQVTSEEPYDLLEGSHEANFFILWMVRPVEELPSEDFLNWLHANRAYALNQLRVAQCPPSANDQGYAQ